jgi:hypothetical protein
MTLEEIYNQLEELQNNLEFYQNRLEQLRTLVLPKATQFDKVMVDGGKRTDNLLKYVEIESEQQLEVTILYITNKINDLNELKEKEIQRLSKYGETIKAVVCLKEREFKTDWNGKKRHLTWQEIADKVYCSPRSARYWYKLGIEERKK